VGRSSCEWFNLRRREALANQRQERAAAGTEQTIVAHFDKTLGQDMLQEAVDELVRLQGTQVGLTSVGIAVAEGDLVVLQADQAAIANGDAKDIRREVLEGLEAIPDRLAVYDPVLFPDRRRDEVKAVGLAQGVAELGAEEGREGFDREQEILPGGEPGLLVR
jgi:hypothetical protein